MIKDNIGKGEIVIQYCPTGDMWANINTKSLQGSLLSKMCGRLMVMGKDYDDGIDRLNTQPDMLPSQESADNVASEDASVLAKLGAIVKVLKVSHIALLNSTNKTQAVVEDLLFTRTMARQTRESASHCRSVLGDKGKPLQTRKKGMCTNKRICVRSPKPRRLTYRQTGTRKLTYIHTGEKGTLTNKLIQV